MKSVLFLDNLNDAVRENPVAAGLIGLGVAWMIFGESRTVVREAQGAVRAAKDTINTAANAATGAIEPTVSGVVDHVRKATTEMRDVVSDGMNVAATKLTDTVSGASAVSRSRSDVDDGHRAFFRGIELVDFLERQPLAVAAIGIGVGAAIAASFPRTAAEDQLVGPAGETLRETAKYAAATAGDRVAAAIDEAMDEAVAQNLTPAAAKEAVKVGATKLKNIAKAGMEATKD